MLFCCYVCLLAWHLDLRALCCNGTHKFLPLQHGAKAANGHRFWAYMMVCLCRRCSAIDLASLEPASAPSRTNDVRSLLPPLPPPRPSIWLGCGEHCGGSCRLKMCS
jgi:hypothetical protein